METLLKCLTLLGCISAAFSQMTVQTRIAPILTECYENVTLKNRDNLPPMTIQSLVEIIRKIEDHPGTNGNLREISTAILHLYRQDGIEYHPTSQGLTNVLPYAPTFFTFYRHKLLLAKLLPTNQFTLDDDVITPYEKCALHHMLSTTVWLESRGDEGSTCQQLSQYRAARLPRHAWREQRSDNDVEVLDKNFVQKAEEIGKMMYDPKTEAEINMFQRQTTATSQCPILDGVVDTEWGAVSAGPLLAGIAAGASPQTVRVLDLMKGTDAVIESVFQSLTVDSRFPATLTGDIAEAALRQGSVSSTQISVGSTGGWNATQARRFYFLQQSTNLELTDPEIRGDIDGLILGMYLTTFQNQFANLKLSQLLEMYYSPMNGVFLPEYRACNRKTVLNGVTTQATLLQESTAFTIALDANMPLSGTITSGLDTLVSTTVTNTLNYITNNLNDVTCTATETVVSDFRPKMNLYVVVDQSWSYSAIYPAIAYLVKQIDVSKFGSSIAILNAADGEVVVNKTFSSAEFYVNYTEHVHQSMPMGVHLPTVFTKLRNLTEWDLESTREHNYVGGNGTAILFMLNSLNVGIDDQLFIEEQAQAMREKAPDFRLIIGTSSSNTGPLVNVVSNASDIIQATLSTSQANVATTMAPILSRLQLVNRNIINPNCGSSWTDTRLETKRLDDFVEPRMINFYRLHPNYFYESHSNRRVRVESTSSNHLRICYSRSVIQPRYDNVTQWAEGQENPVTCHDLMSNGNIEINMDNACNGYSYIGACPPLYISVQSVVTDNTAIMRQCTELACRYPYNVKFSIAVQELGCYSASSSLYSSIVLLCLSVLLLLRV